MVMSYKATRIFCIFAFSFVAIGGAVLLYTGGNITGAAALLLGIIGIVVTILMTREPNTKATPAETSDLPAKALKKRSKSVTIADMYQFTDIPFAWNTVPELQNTNGMAWFGLNRSIQPAALDYIGQINNLITDAHGQVKGISKCVIHLDKIDYDVPTSSKTDADINYTFVECTPYAPTGEIWKYPATLHFASSDFYEYAGKKFPYQPCSGKICILHDGNIGAAEVFFFSGKTSFQIVRSGARLVITSIRSNDTVIFEHEEKDTLTLSPDGIIIPPKDLTHLEKERFMAEHITTEDMLRFSSMPYNLNAPLTKIMHDEEQSAVYINMDRSNQLIAKAELESLNRLILETPGFSVPQEFLIRVDTIAFSQENANPNYTRLICNPYTFAGKIERFPLSLLFMSDLDISDYQTSGRAYYAANGKMEKADAHVTITGPNDQSQGRSFYFETVDKKLVLYKVEIPGQSEDEAEVIYQHEHLIALEAAKAQEEQDYAWLQKTLPDICPKSLLAYRRMKAQNSINYQALQQSAARLGRNI